MGVNNRHDRSVIRETRADDVARALRGIIIVPAISPFTVVRFHCQPVIPQTDESNPSFSFASQSRSRPPPPRQPPASLRRLPRQSDKAISIVFRGRLLLDDSTNASLPCLLLLCSQ